MAGHEEGGGHHELIIIKRHEDDEHEAHSSAWKVAHADFMTAMMAFFLIMWLINVTDENVRKGISEYFNPVHLSSGQAEEKGLTDPHVADPDAKKGNEAGKPNGPKEGEPAKKAEAGEPKSPEKPEPHAKGKSDTSAHDEKAEPKKGEPRKSEPKKAELAGAETRTAEGKPPSSGEKAAAAAVAAAGAAASSESDAKELSALADPYAVLARIRDEAPAGAMTTVAVAADERKPGVVGVTDRDPFDPTYWQTAPTEVLRLNGTLKTPAIDPPPKDALIDAAAPMPREMAPDAAKADAAADPSRPPTESSRSEGKPADVPPQAAMKTEPLPQPGGAGKQAEARDAKTPDDKARDDKAAALRNELADAIRTAAGNAGAPALKVDATPDGLLINLTDDADFSMFAVGSAIPNQRLVKIMDEVGKALARQHGSVVIRGHTDGRPFRSEVYDNWRLSTARAQMAHYMLVHGGLDDKRIVAIEGYADRNLKNKADSYAAENRRIEILIKDAGA
jgi:chemotaxis protein MotB